MANRKDRITMLELNGIPFTVETWWDGQSRNWITQFKSYEGYEIGWAEYVYLLDDAMVNHRWFVENALDIAKAKEYFGWSFTSYRFMRWIEEGKLSDLARYGF